MVDDDSKDKKNTLPQITEEEKIKEIFYSYTLCHKNKCYLRELIERESEKNGNSTLKSTERLVFLAAINLIEKNFLHECGYSLTMDQTGIDIFLAMYLTLRSGKLAKILIHAQIKINNPLAIKKHKNKYPNIPVLIVDRKDDIELIEQKILIFFKKATRKSGYTKLVKKNIVIFLKSYKNKK